MKKTLIATTALLATAGTTVLVAAPANADVERRGTCAGATYEFNVDRERGGFEVSGDLDNARVGSQWRVVLRHEGKIATSRVLTADNEGELDVETFRGNTAGSDTFKLTVTPVGGASCSLKVSVR